MNSNNGTIRHVRLFNIDVPNLSPAYIAHRMGISYGLYMIIDSKKDFNPTLTYIGHDKCIRDVFNSLFNTKDCMHEEELQDRDFKEALKYFKVDTDSKSTLMDKVKESGLTMEELFRATGLAESNLIQRLNRKIYKVIADAKKQSIKKDNSKAHYTLVLMIYYLCTDLEYRKRLDLVSLPLATVKDTMDVANDVEGNKRRYDVRLRTYIKDCFINGDSFLENRKGVSNMDLDNLFMPKQDANKVMIEMTYDMYKDICQTIGTEDQKVLSKLMGFSANTVFRNMIYYADKPNPRKTNLFKVLLGLYNAKVNRLPDFIDRQLLDSSAQYMVGPKHFPIEVWTYFTKLLDKRDCALIDSGKPFVDNHQVEPSEQKGVYGNIKFGNKNIQYALFFDDIILKYDDFCEILDAYKKIHSIIKNKNQD